MSTGSSNVVGRRLNGLVPDEDLAAAPVSDELKAELAVYRVLRPYIGHCLTLNHDLNNPLAGILGYAEFIVADSEHLDEETRANIAQIVTCAERIRDRLDALSEHKMSLVQQVDFESVTAAYQRIAADLPVKRTPRHSR